MLMPAPLATYETTVPAEWLDVNDHMNVAYYVLAFDKATDELFRLAGVGDDYVAARNCSMFALECHVTYNRELRLGDPIRITTQFLGHDAKKMHFCHLMYHGGDGGLAAASEWLGVHVDLNGRRSAAFPDDVAHRLDDLRRAHADLPRPPVVGRVMALKAGRPR